jgi:acyl-coenzyme A synthetase/AMP-(fatty) acid ligase
MLLERILAWAERTPNAPALISPAVVVSHRQLRALVSCAVLELRMQGIKPGDVVGIAISQTPLHPIVFLALGWMGALVIQVPPSLRHQYREALLTKFALAALIGERPEPVPAGCRMLHLPGVGARGDETMDAAGPPAFGADTPLRLGLTSGTTGMPKAVLQTHARLEDRIDRMHCDVADVPRVMPPALHIHLAINLALHALMKGGAIVFPRTYASLDMFDAIAGHGVTHLAIPPANLAIMLPELNVHAPAFPSVKQIRLVGSTPTRAIVEAVRRKMTPNVYVPYGLAELGVVSMATPAMVIEDPASAGVVEPGVQLELVDGGEIRVRLAHQPEGYYGPDAGDRTRFRGDGWFHPGDRGRMSPAGKLYLEGRVDHIINAGGRKVSPEYVESILMEFPGVREAAAFGIGAGAVETRIAVAIVPSGPLDWKALWAFALERMNVSAPVRYIEVASLPRNTMGKLERDGLSESGLPGAQLRLG